MPMAIDERSRPSLAHRGKAGRSRRFSRACCSMALAIILVGWSAGPLEAQSSSVGSQEAISDVTRAAATITPATLAAIAAKFAADSLGPRPTPSVKLDRTAQVIRDELEHLGFWPGFWIVNPQTRGFEPAWE